MPTNSFALVNARAVRPDRANPRVAFEDGITVLVVQGRIASLGRNVTVPPGIQAIDAGGRLLTPGLVDSHTHLVFLGDRAAEFCARCAGASYLDIARQGGGIQSTVRATRQGTGDERLRRARLRLQRLLRQGVTSCEVKTGYGLSSAHELGQLEEIARLSDPLLPKVFPTLLAAHAIPPEVASPAERDRWVRQIAEEIIPAAAARGLAGRVDAFVEQSAYSQAEARVVAEAAKRAGLALHLHVDQLTAGEGAQFAASLGAQAAAHLERTTDAGIEALANAGTVAVLLPTATLAAREPGYAPARKLVQAGVPIALSTNLNPGTAPSESTALMFFLASVALGLTPEESLWAATRGGALALGARDLGLLEVGSPADLVLWNATQLAHLPYHAAVNHVRQVWRAGALVADRSSEVERDCDGAL